MIKQLRNSLLRFFVAFVILAVVSYLTDFLDLSGLITVFVVGGAAVIIQTIILSHKNKYK